MGGIVSIRSPLKAALLMALLMACATPAEDIAAVVGRITENVDPPAAGPSSKTPGMETFGRLEWRRPPCSTRALPRRSTSSKYQAAPSDSYEGETNGLSAHVSPSSPTALVSRTNPGNMGTHTFERPPQASSDTERRGDGSTKVEVSREERHPVGRAANVKSGKER